MSELIFEPEVPCEDCVEGQCTMNCSRSMKQRPIEAHDIGAAARSIIYASDTALQDVAKHDPDMLRDVAAALIAQSDNVTVCGKAIQSALVALFDGGIEDTPFVRTALIEGKKALRKIAGAQAS